MGVMTMNAMATWELGRINTTSKTILVVDDAVLIRSLVSAILTKGGYAVLEADNGKEALDILGKTRVDMIITDLNMPIMDGIQLVREVRSRSAHRHIPVVMLTSEFFESRKRKAFESGINEWVPKPFILRELKDLVFKYA
jgi:two-component system chemotaxis response regulator CheY